MLRIGGDDIYRDGSEVGCLSGTTLYDHSGSKLGYYEGDRIYNNEAYKIAYLEGGYLYEGDRKISLDYVNESIKGGDFPEIAKCAIYLLIGV